MKKKEAERKQIEAEGIKKAQQILREGITKENIEWKSLEVFKNLLPITMSDLFSFICSSISKIKEG